MSYQDRINRAIELKTGLQSFRDKVASLRVEFEVTKSPSPSGAKPTTAEKHSNEINKLKYTLRDIFKWYEIRWFYEKKIFSDY